MPLPVGSMRPSAASAAMAASTADPPCLRMSSAIWVTRAWLLQAMPCWAATSERVAKARPVTRSPPRRGDRAIRPTAKGARERNSAACMGNLLRSILEVVQARPAGLAGPAGGDRDTGGRGWRRELGIQDPGDLVLQVIQVGAEGLVAAGPGHQGLEGLQLGADHA